jgi:hypothetical protein
VCSAGSIVATSHTAERGTDPRNNRDLRSLGVAKTEAGWVRWAKDRIAELGDEPRYRYSVRVASNVLRYFEAA